MRTAGAGLDRREALVHVNVVHVHAHAHMHMCMQNDTCKKTAGAYLRFA